MVGLSSAEKVIAMPGNDSPSTTQTPAANRSGDRLNSPQALVMARVLVPLVFGLYSVWLGADFNWDLLNYHLYNAFAWLNQKWLIDLAPAGVQSYFNPLLHIPILWANTHIPPRLVGFLMGTLHGTSFILLLAIAQRALPALPEADRYRIPLLLALAGCLTGAFLSGLGNSMGDDTTALFVLTGLLLVMSLWDRLGRWSARSLLAITFAGVFVGMGVGLKLTNAVHAVALCLALLSYPATALVRLRLSLFFGIGVLAGMATTTGYWFWHLWQQFGNPLYPQFGGVFPHPFTTSEATGDLRWRPRDLWDQLLWPFLITLNPKRVGEVPVRQLIWPVVYALLLVWGAVRARAYLKRDAVLPIDARSRFVILFVVLGFFVWMQLFSIYRYVVPIEMLTPLVAWLLLHQLLAADKARRSAKWVLVATTAVVVLGGARTWGHSGWSDPLYAAQLPTIDSPARTSIVIASTESRPWAWLATLFSPDIAFMQVESSFPSTPLFREHMLDTARSRGGPVYAVIDGEYHWRADIAVRINRWSDQWGVTTSARGCAALRWMSAKLRVRASVQPPGNPGQHCAIGLRSDDVRDIPQENRDIVARSATLLARNGFDLDAATCAPHLASIGSRKLAFQWCHVTVK